MMLMKILVFSLCLLIHVKQFYLTSLLSDQFVSFSHFSIFVKDMDQLHSVFNDFSDNPYRYMTLLFDNSMILERQIDMKNITQSSFQFLYLLFIRGLTITKNSLPFLVLPQNVNGVNFVLAVYSSFFQLYDKHLQPLDSSCDAYLASYFDLDV